MKSILFIAWLVFLKVPIALAQETQSERVRLPLIVLIEQDPWLWVIGSDSPTFALYDDGLLIYGEKDSVTNKINYFKETHTKDELTKLMNKLNYRQLDTLNDVYKTTDWSDQPTNIVLYNVGEGLRVISVYGDIRTDSFSRIATPKEFTRIFDFITKYNSKRSTKWIPDKYEIMIQPFDGEEKPYNWPSNWPDLNSPNTISRGGQYSLFLDSDKFEEFKIILKNLKQGQSLLINDKRWHATFRIPFPEEDIWMH